MAVPRLEQFDQVKLWPNSRTGAPSRVGHRRPKRTYVRNRAERALLSVLQAAASAPVQWWPVESTHGFLNQFWRFQRKVPKHGDFGKTCFFGGHARRCWAPYAWW